MLDLGFEQDVRDIIGYCAPSKRQTAMFSATWPKSIRDLAAEFLANPVKVGVGVERVRGYSSSCVNLAAVRGVRDGVSCLAAVAKKDGSIMTGASISVYLGKQLVERGGVVLKACSGAAVRAVLWLNLRPRNSSCFSC